MPQKVLVIVGPTASGKSDLAVLLAKKFNGEVVSADSRQVYKGLDIGTGKITRGEMKGVQHHLLDIADPKRRFDAEKYRVLAQKSIRDIASRGKLPIIAGGTGFYIDAIINSDSLSPIPPNPKLRAKLAEKTAAQLLLILKKFDPKKAKNLAKNNSEANNARRLIRHIEIAVVKPASTRSDLVRSDLSPFFIGIKVQPSELRKKINLRLEKRIAAGMVTEAKNLRAKGLSWRRMEELGLEYKYLALYLQKKISAEEFSKRLSVECWHYAKRQMSWFKRNKKIHWFEAVQKSASQKKIEKTIVKFLS